MEEYYKGRGRETFSGLEFFPDYSVSGLARLDCTILLQKNDYKCRGEGVELLNKTEIKCIPFPVKRAYNTNKK